jgi:hypothetical protein
MEDESRIGIGILSEEYNSRRLSARSVGSDEVPDENDSDATKRMDMVNRQDSIEKRRKSIGSLALSKYNLNNVNESD